MTNVEAVLAQDKVVELVKEVLEKHHLEFLINRVHAQVDIYMKKVKMNVSLVEEGIIFV
mgnify:CR=1 FL=1